MQYNPDLHRRQSLRLKEYDYSQNGYYFVTVCTYQKECLFGEINNGKMVLNECGLIVKQCWHESSNHFLNIKLDKFAIMPNHIHGIITIDNCRGTACRAPTYESFGNPVPGSMPTIIRSFKSAVTKQINILRNSPQTPVWHRNYYEHVIRNDAELNKIREYIITNSVMWDLDNENTNH